MEYVRTFTREFDVGERAELRVDNRSGAVTVRGGETRTARIEVVARLWGETEDDADDQVATIERGIEHDGARRVSVRAPHLVRPSGWLFLFGRGPRIDYEITVPRATEAELISRSGRVEVEGLGEPLTVDARSGRVTVAEIGADVGIISRSGHVQATDVGGSLSIESRSGKVQVARCTGNVTVHSRSGALQIEGVGGSLRVENRSGYVGLADVGASLYVRSRSGALRYEGPVKDSFDIELMSGAVTLAIDRESVFMLDAETYSGMVRSDLPVRRDPGDGVSRDQAPTLRVRTHSGMIRLTPR
ncbi:MAG: DUF4097 family beta strand repeat-containing protein [Dehalococcoidia bacterium]